MQILTAHASSQFPSECSHERKHPADFFFVFVAHVIKFQVFLFLVLLLCYILINCHKPCGNWCNTGGPTPPTLKQASMKQDFQAWSLWLTSQLQDHSLDPRFISQIRHHSLIKTPTSVNVLFVCWVTPGGSRGQWLSVRAQYGHQQAEHPHDSWYFYYSRQQRIWGTHQLQIIQL